MVQQKADKFFIGMPKESAFQENRVPLTPSSVAILVGNGHRVLIEAGAGLRSHFSDHEYSEAGAEIAYDRQSVLQSGILLKVAPPSMEEIECFKPGQIIISPIHLPTLSADYIYRLKEKRVIALAWEYIKDKSGTYPFVRTLSELAGLSSVLVAAELLSNLNHGRGLLLGGISGVPSSKVVVLGAGVVAEHACRAALGLGAEVRVFDNNVYKLMRLQNNVGRQIYTSTINPKFLERELLTADVVIGAIHSSSGRTPVIVSEEIVEKMQPSSVIIDVSIDQGGCFATSRVTTHDRPTFIEHDVIHYCVPNIASRVSRTASRAVSNILTPMILNASDSGSIEQMLYDVPGFQQGVYMYKGTLTNHHLGSRFKIKSTDLHLLLTSNL